MENKQLLKLDLQFFAGNPNEALFYEVLSAPALAAVVSENAFATEPYLGEALFPSQKVEGLNLSYIKDTKGVPMVLKPSQFDTKAPIRDRMAVQLFQEEMPLFREGMILGERERQELFDALRRSPESYRIVLNRIYNDQLTLVEGANAQAERMRMQALTTGAINIIANGEYLTADYGVPANQKFTLASADEWNKPAADVLKTIKQAKKLVRDATGKQLRYMVMNSLTFDNLLNNNQFKALVNPLANGIPVLLESDLMRTIETYTGLRVVLYDKVYLNENGVTTPFFPEGVVTFLPEGNMGYTNYGTTPEEFDLLNTSNHRANVSIVNTGVAITTYKQEHPVNSKTIVSQIVMPSFEQALNVVIVNVYTPAP